MVNIGKNYMADYKFEIIREIGVLSESKSGWRKELNLVSWNGGQAKFEIRDWSPDHEKAGKGVTFTEEELKALTELLENLQNNEEEA